MLGGVDQLYWKERQVLLITNSIFKRDRYALKGTVSDLKTKIMS